MGIDAEIHFTTHKPLTREELANLCYRLHDCFPDETSVVRCDGRNVGPIKRHCIAASEWSEECDEGRHSTPADPCRYEVSLGGRYYGDGYERGDWPVLCAIMDWLVRQPCVSDVFYGSDCGNFFERFADVRDSISAIFATVGHLPYLIGKKGDSPSCPDCGQKMWNSGWRNHRTMYSCSGCGYTDWEAVGEAK